MKKSFFCIHLLSGFQSTILARLDFIINLRETSSKAGVTIEILINSNILNI